MLLKNVSSRDYREHLAFKTFSFCAKIPFSTQTYMCNNFSYSENKRSVGLMFHFKSSFLDIYLAICALLFGPNNLVDKKSHNYCITTNL